MTRDEIAAIAAENGIELTKGFISQCLTAFNAEKKNAVVEAANKALDDFKDWKSPDEYAELENKLNEITETSAKHERTAKYRAAGLNVDDEDILNLIDSKFKDSKNIEKDVAEYAKAHPSFVKTAEIKQEPAEPKKEKFSFGDPQSKKQPPQEVRNMTDAVTAEIQKQLSK